MSSVATRLIFHRRGIIMNKGELVEAVAKSAGVSVASAHNVVSAVFGEITKSLKKKQKVAIIGFGTFSVSKRKARKGRNPKTGEVIDIKAQNSPKFKAGMSLKDAVN